MNTFYPTMAQGMEHVRCVVAQVRHEEQQREKTGRTPWGRVGVTCRGSARPDSPSRGLRGGLAYANFTGFHSAASRWAAMEQSKNSYRPSTQPCSPRAKFQRFGAAHTASTIHSCRQAAGLQVHLHHVFRPGQPYPLCPGLDKLCELGPEPRAPVSEQGGLRDAQHARPCAGAGGGAQTGHACPSPALVQPRPALRPDLPSAHLSGPAMR